MPTVTEAYITNRRLVRDDVKIWRKVDPELTEAEEAAIIPGWLPSSPDWEDVTDQVRFGAGVRIALAGGGPAINLQIDQHAQTDWPYRLPVAIVGRHWDGGDWYEHIAAWGRVVGSGGQRRKGADRSGELILDLARWWLGTNVPAHRLGRLNAALGASLAGGSATLATPLSESPQEYINQASCAATMLVDGNVDTVAVANAFADPAIPTIGDTTKPRLLRLYAGRTDRAIGAGGEPIFVEIWYGHDTTPWGTTWTGIPEMYNAAGGEGKPAIRDDDRLTTTVESDGDGGQCLRVFVKQNTNPKGDTWIQWITGSATYTNVPMKVRMELRASPVSPAAQGRRLHIAVGDSRTVGATVKEVKPFVLSADWQEVEFPFDSSTDYGGAKISIKSWPGESQDGGWRYEVRRLQVGMGWDHDEYARKNNYVALRLGIDDGAGNERWVRFAWDLAAGQGNFSIPPFDSIIVTDDIDTLKRKFDVGNRTVYQMKNLAPWWFFGPLVGRLKLALMHNPISEFDIDLTTTGTYDLLDDVDFPNRPDLVWTPQQAMSRQSDIGTGQLATEDFPQIGVIPAFDSAYWYFALAAPDFPTLLYDIPIGAARIPVSDPDRYNLAGIVRIGAESIAFSGKDGEYLLVVGATLAAHTQGDEVVPRWSGHANYGANDQTGRLLDYVELRRKEGKATIMDGFLLYSNATAPGDPGVGGSKWETHPDWELLTRFSGNTLSTIGVAPPVSQVWGGYAPVIQARYLCVGISRMNRTFGKRERGKANELVAREWVPGSIGPSHYLGHGVGTVNDAIGHIFVRHGLVPIGKFINAAPPVALNDVHIAPTTVGQAVASLTQKGLLNTVVDQYGYVTLEPSPASFLFDRQTVEWTWTEANSWGAEQTGTWDEPQRVSQVVAWGYDPVAMKHYRMAYPQVPNRYGSIVEVKDLIVSSPDQLREIARARFRDGNTRRGLRVKAGACPWLRVNQRHIVDYPNLDPGGAWAGINFYVESFGVDITRAPDGAVLWITTISLREMAL